MLRHVRYALGFGVRRRTRRQSERFLRATEDCRGSQHAVLREILDGSSGSRFSHDFGLNRARTVAEFRAAIPVGDFERVRPYIEDLKRGDRNALLGPRHRLVMFALSSGTTGDSKFIPITERFLSDYRRGWQIWGINAFDDHPAMQRLNIFQLVSDFDKFRTPSGVPAGNISGLVQHMQNPIVRTMYCVPPPSVKIMDAEAKYYTALRIGLADRHVGLVMTANPSTLVHVAELADARKESLIRDLRNGTLAVAADLPSDIRLRLCPWTLQRQRRRAAELDAIAERTGRLMPRDFWPNLQLIGVWTGGSAGAYLPALRRWFGETPIRDHGLSASEGRMTIPLQDGTSSGVLDVTSHFFEFIPVDEIDSPQPTVLEAHELIEGREYFILLTTPSGLYRYNIHDVVRCTGFRRTTPILAFQHKGAHIANVTGEKLSESQVAVAVSRCLERLNLHPGYLTLAPVWSEPPHYRLMLEGAGADMACRAAELAAALDCELQQLNCEYQDKRQSGRLSTVESTLLPRGTWMRFAKHRQRGPGGSAEQYKHPCLCPDLAFHDQVINQFAQTVDNSVARTI